MCNGNNADLHDLNILSRFTSPDPGMHWVPDKNPGSDSDTVCLKRDRVQTCHASDPIYIVSCADTSCWLPEESRDRVGRSLEPDPTRTSSYPAPEAAESIADFANFKKELRTFFIPPDEELVLTKCFYATVQGRSESVPTSPWSFAPLPIKSAQISPKDS